MGVGTLNNRSAGQTILDTFFNDIHGALDGDFVGRDSNGIASAGQNLGTDAFPWGSIRGNSLILNGSAVDTSKITSPVNRIISGKRRSTSNQPAYITPNGGALSLVVAGATTSLVYDVNGTSYTLSADLTKSSLTAAPSSQNTALVNDALAIGQEDTRLWGEPEHRKVITIDTVGTGISALVGKFAAFKIGTEYFMALVESATALSHCRRGYFYDSSLNPFNRSKFSDNDQITLMKLGWIFIDQDMTTIDVAYNNPSWSFAAPSSPATGDYWYDLANGEWKRYDGASWAIINRVFIGYCVMDSANCVAARCTDFYATYSDVNTLDIEISTTEITVGTKPFSAVNVAGNLIQFHETLPQWNITTDLVGSADMYNASEQASTLYHLYLRDDGKPVISDISPYYRNDLQGRYHPHNPWRAVGMLYNDGSSNIVQANGIEQNRVGEVVLNGENEYGSTAPFIKRWTTLRIATTASIVYLDSTTEGSSFLINEEGFYAMSMVESDSNGTGQQAGLTLNQIDLTKVTSDCTVAEIIHGALTAGQHCLITAEVYLKIGDIVRTVGSGGTDAGLTVFNSFRIAKVA